MKEFIDTKKMFNENKRQIIKRKVLIFLACIFLLSFLIGCVTTKVFQHMINNK